MRLQNSIYYGAVIAFLFLTACQSPKKESATLLIHGGPIYTVDSSQTMVEAVATKDNTILFAGSLAEAEQYKNNQTQLIDLEGKTMTPGLIEGHGHFMGLGYNELNLDLINTTSYQEIVDAVAEKVST
ncbi:MAG: amidohydrolase family protein, partial [Maribacter sp.]|nr:amidohydrolase family protein [Maribacter sp.]